MKAISLISKLTVVLTTIGSVACGDGSIRLRGVPGIDSARGERSVESLSSPGGFSSGMAVYAIYDNGNSFEVDVDVFSSSENMQTWSEAWYYCFDPQGPASQPPLKHSSVDIHYREHCDPYSCEDILDVDPGQDSPGGLGSLAPGSSRLAWAQYECPEDTLFSVHTWVLDPNRTTGAKSGPGGTWYSTITTVFGNYTECHGYDCGVNSVATASKFPNP